MLSKQHAFGACGSQRVAPRVGLRAAPSLAPRPWAALGLPRAEVQAQAMAPFSGTNCYYILEKAAANSQYDEQLVKQTLQDIKQLGFTVIRMWAFNEDPHKFPLHNRGQLNPAVMKRFDWLMKEVAVYKGELKLMMTLTNHLPDYGGMMEYVKWAAQDDGRNLVDTEKITDKEERRIEEEKIADMFYTYDKAKVYYNTFVTNLVNYYKDSEWAGLIHSWDICNEPRNKTNAAGNLATWVNEAAQLVKSLDPKTPVTVGTEGFFGPSSEEFVKFNPYGGDQGIEGCDFVRDCRSPYLDFYCLHIYPDQWGIKAKDYASWSKQWVQKHIECCATYLPNKPLVAQEYNVKKQYEQERIGQFQAVRELLKGSVTSKPPKALQGAMVWMMADPSYPDNDGYMIYTTGNAAQLQPLIEQNKDMAGLPPPS